MYDFLGMVLAYEELNEYQKHKADWLENIARYRQNTKKVYWVIFNSKVNMFEIKKNKDLYDFNKEEIIEVVRNSETKVITNKQILYTVIVRYMDWAYKEGIKVGENPCDSIDTKELFTIDELAFKESYRTLQEFYDFILGLNCSDVDRAMITLLRYGVKIDDVGKIKWEDVDRENKTLKINHMDEENFDNNYIIELPIDNLFIMMIDKAKTCDRYAPGQKLVEYVDYGYVIKATPTVKWKDIDKLSVYNRVGVISRNNKIQRISVSDLTTNRKYDLLFNILNDYGKVTKSDVEKVIEILGEELTPMKLTKLKRNFELISGIKVE